MRFRLAEGHRDRAAVVLRGVEVRLTAAIPMDRTYCSCKLMGARGVEVIGAIQPHSEVVRAILLDYSPIYLTPR